MIADPFRAIPIFKFSERIAEWSKAPERMTLSEKAQASVIVYIHRGAARCFACGGAVDARCSRIITCEFPSGTVTAAAFCKRCRKKLDRDDKFNTAIHSRIEQEAKVLDGGAAAPSAGSA